MKLKYGKDFNPRTNNVGDGSAGVYAQISNWALVRARLDLNGGTATKKELVLLLRTVALARGYADNSVGFISRRINHGHLVVVI